MINTKPNLKELRNLKWGDEVLVKFMVASPNQPERHTNKDVFFIDPMTCIPVNRIFAICKNKETTNAKKT